MPSKQYLSQLRKRARGLCAHCPQPLDPQSGTYCSAHLERARVQARNRYREAHGIPLDDPLLKQGRPRGAMTCTLTEPT